MAYGHRNVTHANKMTQIHASGSLKSLNTICPANVKPRAMRPSSGICVVFRLLVPETIPIVRAIGYRTLTGGHSARKLL